MEYSFAILRFIFRVIGINVRFTTTLRNEIAEFGKRTPFLLSRLHARRSGINVTDVMCTDDTAKRMGVAVFVAF